MYVVDINYTSDAPSVLYTGDDGLEESSHVAVRIAVGHIFMDAVDAFKAIVANNMHLGGIEYIRLVLITETDSLAVGHPGSGGTVLSRKSPRGVGDW